MNGIGIAYLVLRKGMIGDRLDVPSHPSSLDNCIRSMEAQRGMGMEGLLTDVYAYGIAP